MHAGDDVRNTMFTDKAQAIIDQAKDFAFADNARELNIRYLLASVAKHPGTLFLMAQCLGLSTESTRAACPAYEKSEPCRNKMPLGDRKGTLLNSSHVSESG